ncbi:conserved hypothetical protein [Culex quinquefasciatus]|uniref:Uncharacterized protein n=1 Tax=Culex quinquefasciatus TaxID=7176 RepID=B0WI13_CULQU|nr:conserved hypothetical protein [Culex quinquefasciatus]|eukprot:XP_001848347.1 conserved hypothetical protein [Culex quinquefasciatus]
MPEGDNIQPDGNLLYERLLQQNERLEAQNARMMEMLERFNLQDASSPSESTAWHEEHLRWNCSQYLTA